MSLRQKILKVLYFPTDNESRKLSFLRCLLKDMPFERFMHMITGTGVSPDNPLSPESNKRTPDATAVLGIPIDNLSMEEAVLRIFEMIEAYKIDHRPRYVATVNVDFITNILSWRFKQTRHPELAHILQQADMVTADGMPIVWASRWLGAPLKERIAGSDLVPGLVDAAEKQGKSIYFLGGKRFEMTAYRAAREVEKKYPGLRVAGIDSPWVHVAGEALTGAEEEDKRIVDKINNSGADILLIAFGSPKQEIWFDRNRHRLHVAVAVGVGATFEFLAGTETRAPKWMQRTGFEWFYRLAQEPRRLWKRYLVDFLKFGIFLWPSVFYYGFECLRRSLPGQHNDNTTIKVVDDSSDHAIKKLYLSGHIDRVMVSAIRENIQRLCQPQSVLILDFSMVRSMTINGIGSMARIWQQALADGKPLAVTGLHPRIQRYLSVNRLMDYFKNNRYFDAPKTSVYKKDNARFTPFFYTIEYISDGIVQLRFSGVLDTREAAKISYKTILKDIGQRDCILNLENLSYIGSSGFIMLLNMSNHILGYGKCFVICSVQSDIQQLIFMSDLKRLLVIRKDLASATDFIHEVQGEPSLKKLSPQMSTLSHQTS